MQPEPAPYTSEQIKREIERVRRNSGDVAVALIAIAVLACLAAFAASMGILG
ncbi:MAG: hypothetical protein IJI68_12850 [Eggerthellaceae bacterium]|jgi:hypothetical protein|nr:hypothetical protein [Eggerthellaceae bacterium]